MRTPWALAATALAVALLLAPSPAAAGGWTQAQGGGYAKVWLRFQAAIGFLDGYHDDAGDFRYFDDYAEIGLHGYFEYGVLDELTLVGGWSPTQLYWVAQHGRVVARPTDPMVGARWGIHQGEWVLALEADVTLPFVTDRSFGSIQEIDMDTGLEGDTIAQLQVGSGGFQIEPRIQFGFGFERGHFGVEAGWRFRANNLQDSLIWRMEGGYRFIDPLYVSVRITHVNPQGPGEVVPNEGSPSGVTSGTLFFGYALEVDWLLDADDGLSVGGSLEGATFYARQAGGPVFSAYLARKW